MSPSCHLAGGGPGKPEVYTCRKARIDDGFAMIGSYGNFGQPPAGFCLSVARLTASSNVSGSLILKNSGAGPGFFAAFFGLCGGFFAMAWIIASGGIKSRRLTGSTTQVSAKRSDESCPRLRRLAGWLTRGAAVAELADARALEARNTERVVRVRLPFAAPFFTSLRSFVTDISRYTLSVTGRCPVGPPCPSTADRLYSPA
jgi:hypothetical protein